MQSCGGVVDAIEEGDLILAEALVRSHVAALKRKMPRPDVAILGCTHYPLMEQIFKDALGPGVQVYSQARLVSDSLADYLVRHPKMHGAGQKSKFITTGSPRQVSDHATQFLRCKITFEPLSIANFRLAIKLGPSNWGMELDSRNGVWKSVIGNWVLETVGAWFDTPC